MTLDDLDVYRLERTAELADIFDAEQLETWRQAQLGRAGQVQVLRRSLRDVPASERPRIGAAVNTLAAELEAAYRVQAAAVRDRELRGRMARSALDVTLPPAARRTGRLHPVTAVMNEICDRFRTMGFGVFESPEVELDDINFQQLNMPKDHPARDMQDTFYVCEEVVLRTHTSPGQIRAMRRFAPQPCRVVLPGRCFRNEDITPRSEIQFHQVEGLIVGPQVRFSDLKGVLLRFARDFYGPDQDIRLRGSYFPFTEPSVEIDIRCTLCGGAGCRICKDAGWLEVLGAGLVHPTVLRNGGYDPDLVRGVAFGMGVERSLLLRHQVQDIRHLFQNDLRFLQQFPY